MSTEQRNEHASEVAESPVVEAPAAASAEAQEAAGGVQVPGREMSKPRKRRARKGPAAGVMPGWYRELRVLFDLAEEADFQAKRARARRNRALAEANRVHGASLRWLADELGMSSVRVLELVRAGEAEDEVA